MILVKISKFVFFCFLFFSEISYGIDFKIKNEEGYDFSIIDNKSGEILVDKINFLSDGMYLLKKVTVINNRIIITTEFNGSGHQQREYVYEKENEKFLLTKERVRYVDIDNHSRIRVCEYSFPKIIEDCFYEVREKSYLYEYPNKKVPLYLDKGDKIKLLQEKVDSKNKKWYLVSYRNKTNTIMWVESQTIDYD